MMIGPEHYREAERLLATLDDDGAYRGDWDAARAVTEIAQVHATLALAAATALGVLCDDRLNDAWAQWGGDGGASELQPEGPS